MTTRRHAIQLMSPPEPPGNPYQPPQLPTGNNFDEHQIRLFNLLVRTLPVRRPAGSEAEKTFLQSYFSHVWLHDGAFLDEHGNLHVYIPSGRSAPDGAVSPCGADTDRERTNSAIAEAKRPTILWSAHTDDVSRDFGWPRRIAFDPKTKTFGFHHSETNRSGLGADNLAGIVILSEMVRANVPGYYVFHTSEECGCVGSKALAKSLSETWGGQLPAGNVPIENVIAAIAFDRREFASVITHQYSGRTCSDSFATALASLLRPNVAHQPYQLDDGGVYTDTVSYIGLIGECTNVSAGTMNEHASNEMLDFAYLAHLARRMAAWTQADTDALALACTRKAGEVDRDDYAGAFGMRGGWSWDDWTDVDTPGGASRAARSSRARDRSELRALEDICTTDPDLVAAFLHDQGITADVILWFEQAAINADAHDDPTDDDEVLDDTRFDH